MVLCKNDSRVENLDKTVVKRKSLDNRLVLFRAFEEFFFGELAVAISVHKIEDSLDSFFGRVVVILEVGVIADHRKDSFDNLEHLVARDCAVVVQIVESECPFELVLEPPAGSDRKRLKKLFKFDRAVAVLVENVEHEGSKSTWVAMGKELVVDLCELVFGQLAGRAILEEAIVPVTDFFRSEFRLLRELVDGLRIKL